MKISIITTSFNASKYIEKTLDSVLSQKGDFDLEYIIIDGASTDGTQDIIKRRISDFSKNSRGSDCPRIEFLFRSESDEGFYDGLTKGLQLISDDADIVAYINADDLYLPNSLATVCEIFKQNKDVFWLTGRKSIFNSMGSCIPVDQNLPFRKRWIQRGFYGLVFNPIQQESTFWRRLLLDDIDCEQLKIFRYAGDFYLWKVFSMRYQLFSTNVCLGGFRKHTAQLSDNRKQYRQEMDQIRIRPNPFESLMMRVMRKTRRFLPHVIVVYLASQFTIVYRQSTNSWSVMSRHDRIVFAKRQTRL